MIKMEAQGGGSFPVITGSYHSRATFPPVALNSQTKISTHVTLELLHKRNLKNLFDRRIEKENFRLIGLFLLPG